MARKYVRDKNGRFASKGGGVGNVGKINKQTGKPTYAGGSSTPSSYKELQQGALPGKRGEAAFKEVFAGGTRSAAKAQAAGASGAKIKGIERAAYKLGARRERNVAGLTRQRRYARPK